MIDWKQALLAFTLCWTAFGAAPLRAQHEHHEHEHGEAKPPVAPPKVFLDKSPRIVWYQLNRLDNERLLLVERKTDDAKYAPVYTAILTRAGMSPQHRQEALEGLVALKKSDGATELLDALATIKGDNRQERRTVRQLASMLLSRSATELSQRREALVEALAAESPMLRSVSHAGLITADLGEVAWKAAMASDQGKLDWLGSISLLPRPELRGTLRSTVVELLAESESVAVRRGALAALAAIPTEMAKTFEAVASYAAQPEFRPTAVRTLLRVPSQQRSAATSARLLETLTTNAEATAVAQRTTNDFLEAMQLADQLLGRVPEAAARAYRKRLREVAVRVVVIHTVEEEMRYDTPYFAVEAGRPVQLLLKNEDLMPHNLVITVPDALQEVAGEGALLGPDPGFEGKPYVPKSDKVLFATGMVGAEQQERLTFTAPKEPGEYPFVCTFPRHWMRMYGVMIVVDDLDAWAKNPTVPKDPTGSNRSFVKSWTMEDFREGVEEGMRGRTAAIGERLFKEATCAQCHKIGDQGGSVGPPLTDVFKRWKGDRQAVLREILDPSHRIDPKYAMHLVITTDGKVLTGIVQSEDKQSVSLLINPESPKPTIVPQDDIDEMVKTSKSMMPKALLDRFTRDEIFELLSYLETVGTAP